jgi:hypothetical protein
MEWIRESRNAVLGDLPQNPDGTVGNFYYPPITKVYTPALGEENYGCIPNMETTSRGDHLGFVGVPRLGNLVLARGGGTDLTRCVDVDGLRVVVGCGVGDVAKSPKLRFR